MAIFTSHPLSQEELRSRERGREDLQARIDLLWHTTRRLSAIALLLAGTGTCLYYVLIEGQWPPVPALMAPVAALGLSDRLKSARRA